MSAYYRLVVLPALLLVALIATSASAQVLSIGNGEVRRGASVDIPVQFDAGPAPVAAFEMKVVYDPARFDPPVCFGHHGASCAVNHSLGQVSLLHFNFSLAPVASGTYMTIRFPAARIAPRGSSPLGARAIIWVDPQANPVDGTIYTGTIQVR